MNEASLRGDDFIIERAGKPMAVLVSVEKYRIMERARDRARIALDNIRGKMKKAVPDNVDSLVREAVKATRKKQR